MLTDDFYVSFLRLYAFYRWYRNALRSVVLVLFRGSFLVVVLFVRLVYRYF